MQRLEHHAIARRDLMGEPSRGGADQRERRPEACQRRRTDGDVDAPCAVLVHHGPGGIRATGKPLRKAAGEPVERRVDAGERRVERPHRAGRGRHAVTRVLQLDERRERSAPEIGRLDFPAYHNRPSAPTNLTLHQAIDLNLPIGCGDVAVFPGDIVVGDDEGVVVIPAHLAGEIAAEAVEMTAFEDFVTEEVLGGTSILGLYPPTEEANAQKFAAWRKKTGR